MAHKTTLKEFEAVFPKLEADLLEQAQKYKLPKGELEWYKTVGHSRRGNGTTTPRLREIRGSS